jgi:alpha-beta hydrolase superfamily lysophospholipase
MPFIEHPRGRAYYRHWATAEPRPAVIFLHGFGEHTGLYHRYGFALNAAGIDLWAVDQFGHGLSPGPRGDFGSIEDSSALADTLIELAEGASPGLPLIAQEHSFGSVVTLFRLLDQPQRYRAGVISGAPLVPIPEMLDTDSSFNLDPGWLSADPFYVDSLENDPLAFVDGDVWRWPENSTGRGIGSAPSCPSSPCRRWLCTAPTIRSRRSTRCVRTQNR